MEEEKPNRWLRLKKLSLNRKDLSKRMKKVEGVTMRHARKFIFRRLTNMRDVRRHIITWILAIGILIGATGLQLMWYQQSYRTTTAGLDGTYAEAVLGPVETLNPLYATTSAEQAASHLLFSSILTYDRSGRSNYDIAKSVSIDESGKVYTVTIRDDVKWHDGITLTTDDIAFTVGLLKNPVVHSTVPADWTTIKVDVLNDTTMTFTLPTVIAAFEDALTFPIVPKHILSKVEPNALRESDFSKAPIGSGPFKLRFVQSVDPTLKRTIVHLERHNAYYQGAAKLERFQLHVYDSQDAILRALATGEVNAAADLSANNLHQIDRQRYDIRTNSVNSGVYALFNVMRDGVKDKAVREALQRATDTTLLRAKLSGVPGPLTLPFIKGQLTGALPEVPTYNVDEAKKLLDGAGWKLEGSVRKKDGIELRLTVVTTKDSEYERALEIIVGQWRELGITIETQIFDPNDVSQHVVKDILQPRNFDVLLRLLPIGADPDVYAYWHSSQATIRGSNFSNYSNPISDDALASARSRLEPDLRNAKYLTFARQWVADVPAIGLYQSNSYYITSKNVAAFNSKNTLIAPVDRYADILYWSVGSKTVFKTP